MRIKSSYVNYIITQMASSLRRFPFVLIAALVVVSINIYLFEKTSKIEREIFMPLINIMLTALLGIPLFIGITVFSEKFKADKVKKIIYNILGLAFLIFIYFTLPVTDDDSPFRNYGRYVIYGIALHLWVSFIPYIKPGEYNGFWQYNRILLTRLILSYIYSSALYLGIMLALLSFVFLFNINIYEKIYFHLYIVTTGFITTWIFVSGIPEKLEDLDKLQYYPFSLKVFAQYISLPLLTIYLIILYLYEIKIILFWDWPKGIISWMVIVASVNGIFTFLLIYPEGQKTENFWIRQFTKLFYYLLIPLIVMLFISIYMRVVDYGVTINRYLLIVLGIWLTILSLYFIINQRNIKFIPASLCITILLTSFGPWGMFSVSEKSQVNRLKKILEERGILKDGKIVNEQRLVTHTYLNQKKFQYPNQHRLNDSLTNEVKSILGYLEFYHDLNSVNKWFKTDYATELINYNRTHKENKIKAAEFYMRAMGLDYEYHPTNQNDVFFVYSSKNQDAYNITGYEYMVNIYYLREYNDSTTNSNTISFTLDSIYYTLKLENNHNLYSILLLKENEKILSIALNDAMKRWLDKYGKKSNYDLPEEELTLVGRNGNIDYKLQLNEINLRNENHQIALESVQGVLLFKTP